MPLEEVLLFFAAFIETECGIVYAEHNYYQLQNRLEDICRLLSFGTVQDLHKKAVKDGIHGSFRELLVDLATNNETSFFRDQKVFKKVKDDIIPELSENLGADNTLRVWSAASSRASCSLPDQIL